ncbi:MAG: hypothetical protein QXQ64_01000 [Candidatus Bathyarchaeia archaeon]
MPEKCKHGEVELLGEQRGDKGVNRYYRCLKCGCILILSEDGVLYEVAKGQSKLKHY